MAAIRVIDYGIDFKKKQDIQTKRKVLFLMHQFCLIINQINHHQDQLSLIHCFVLLDISYLLWLKL